jgi:hypothetical protein
MSAIPEPADGVLPKLSTQQVIQLQPNLARLMPEIGNRLWRAAFAARASNWPLARWQLSEMRKLFVICMTTRPKYGTDIGTYLEEETEPMLCAVEHEDLQAFERVLEDAIDAANEFHRRWNKGFITWQLPDTPPSDLKLRGA